MYELLGDENCDRNASKTNLVHFELNLGREEVAEASKSAASEISVLIETGFSGLIFVQRIEIYRYIPRVEDCKSIQSGSIS